ncbi:MAG: hypothetical protein JRF02_03890 [Deltaproteobacteria bacterium]|nr:hypothetical protein [Deltaproteobacteria bacterium]
MANRRITELPSILGVDLSEQDLLTLVQIFEVDPTLKNKKITLSEFKKYLDTSYVKKSSVPASSSSTGTAGQIATDSDYIYVCTATDQWKRANLISW